MAPGSLFGAGVNLALAQVQRFTLLEIGLSYTACALVAQGLGISIVDPPTAEQFIGRGVTVRPVSVPIDTSFVVIRSRSAREPALVQLSAEGFLEFVNNPQG